MTQIAAAQAAFMLATGGTLKDACDHLDWSSRSQVPLRRLWWHLESLGELEQYFDAVARAAQAFLHEHHTDHARRPVDAPIAVGQANSSPSPADAFVSSAGRP